MDKKDYSKYKNQWAAQNLDRIALNVEKGKKDIIKEHAKSMGETLNGFINRAINETIERDKK